MFFSFDAQQTFNYEGNCFLHVTPSNLIDI
jgi:hypothetical protein